MSKALIDSNVLLDIFNDDPVWFEWSASCLSELSESTILVINPMIYAEISVGFSHIEVLDQILKTNQFEYMPLSREVCFLAAKAHKNYRLRGGVKRSTLPDFFIGAQAAIEGMTLLTRDKGRYHTYFPTVKVICPESSGLTV